MGMYTELSLGIELKKETPDVIINILKGIIIGDLFDPKVDHPLLRTDRWYWLLASAGSYYFDRKPNTIFKKDDITNTYFLSFTSNIKNYGSEWEYFLDFISPYIETNGYIGTYMYEEWEDPILLYNRNGKITYKDPKRLGEGNFNATSKEI
jgi:hypothetical protein